MRDPISVSLSWVIRERQSGRVLFETWSRKLVLALNTARYEAVPILQYLQGVNRAIREAANGEA